MLYGLAGIIFSGYILGYIVSRKEQAADGSGSLLRPFWRMGMYLYKRACTRKIPDPCRKTIRQTLKMMHPGEDPERLYLNYCVKKLAISLALILAGTVFAVLVSFKGLLERNLQSGAIVRRGEYTEGNKELELTVKVEEIAQESFKIEVKSRALTRSEAEELYQSFRERLPEWILGENPSLWEVYMNLTLEEKYGDYPFEVVWKSKRPEIVSGMGTVFVQEEPQETELEAQVAYGEWSWQERIPVIVKPPALTQEQQVHRKLQQLLTESEEESRMEENWVLPGTWEGKALDWKESRQDYGITLWLLALVTSVLVYFMADRDLGEQLEKRRCTMKQEYPELLHKLVLYLGAGMTVRGAFVRVTRDYEGKSNREKRASPICEEMRRACRELQAGVSEGAVYEHFGKRTGVQQYIRLGTLLQQNLKKGNSTLLERLREEAEKAMTEQIQQGRKMGEEAATKLLLPMVIILAVVMIIIMVPAFTSIG